MATDYPDGHGDLWWLALEKVIVKVNALTAKIDGNLRRFRCGTPAEKDATFHSIYWWLRGIDEADARSFVRELCHGIDVDADALTRDLMMTWDEIRALAEDPLVTIGAHTRRHYALAKLTMAEAKVEIDESVRRVQRETGKVVPPLQLSLRRRDERRRARVRSREGDGAEDGRDDPQGPHPCAPCLRADGAAAGLAQRRLSEAALREGAAERRAVRLLQFRAEGLEPAHRPLRRAATAAALRPCRRSAAWQRRQNGL